jgi:hypothetical protein
MKRYKRQIALSSNANQKRASIRLNKYFLLYELKKYGGEIAKQTKQKKKQPKYQNGTKCQKHRT